MSVRRALASLLSFATALALGSPIGAQCVEWSSGEFPSPHAKGPVEVLAVADDGTGPALFAGGSFGEIGGVSSRSIARLRDGRWTPLGKGLLPFFRGVTIRAIAAFDGAIHVGGQFLVDGDPAVRSLARWNGREFVAVAGPGAPARVDALAVFDDGSGAALYAGGVVDGKDALLRWDGTAWTTIFDFGTATVQALAVVDDGFGPALFIAARDYFQPSFTVARWNGAAFADIGASLAGPLNALAVFDDGSGPALYGGGAVGLSGIARWNGRTWTEVPTGLGGEVLTLAASGDPPPRQRLAAGNLRGIAIFDGAAWTVLGDDSPGGTTLAWFAPSPGSGDSLFAARTTSVPPPPMGRFREDFVRWDGARWLPPAPGIDSGPRDLQAFDDGRGPAVFATGEFEQAGDAPASGIARYDGCAWSTLGAGLESGLAFGSALATFDDGRGEALYVGGRFTTADGVAARNVARWDGTTFEPLGVGLDGDCYALATFDDGAGPALYAAGDFLTAGGVAARRIAKWDGAAWTPVGAGFNGRVGTLAAIDDGTGRALFAAGSFSRASGVSALRIAKWDGLAWSPLGSGADGDVTSLAEFDFGGGTRLVAGGSFFSVGGVASPRVAFWDGTAWNRLDVAIPSGISVRVMRVEELGRPAALFLSSCGGGPADDGCVLARWNAGAFEELLPAPDGFVTDLVSFDDGFGASLYASGHFSGFGAGKSAGFARRSVGDAAARSGNVNAGRGALADVVTVDGSSGDAACRRVVVEADVPTRLDVLRPPVGGRGDYLLWILDGASDPRRSSPARLPVPGRGLVDLGAACRPLPIENLTTPGAVPCPIAFPFALSSRRSGAVASALCLEPGGRVLRRAPAAFHVEFPRGVYTIAGVVLDPGSGNAVPVSLSNAVIVEAR